MPVSLFWNTGAPRRPSRPLEMALGVQHAVGVDGIGAAKNLRMAPMTNESRIEGFLGRRLGTSNGGSGPRRTLRRRRGEGRAEHLVYSFHAAAINDLREFTQSILAVRIRCKLIDGESEVLAGDRGKKSNAVARYAFTHDSDIFRGEDVLNGPVDHLQGNRTRLAAFVETKHELATAAADSYGHGVEIAGAPISPIMSSSRFFGHLAAT